MLESYQCCAVVGVSVSGGSLWVARSVAQQLGFLVHMSTDSPKVNVSESDVPQWLAYAVQREMHTATPDRE